MNLETEERIRSAMEAGSIAIFEPSGLSPMAPPDSSLFHEILSSILKLGRILKNGGGGRI